MESPQGKLDIRTELRLPCCLPWLHSTTVTSLYTVPEGSHGVRGPGADGAAAADRKASGVRWVASPAGSGGVWLTACCTMPQGLGGTRLSTAVFQRTEPSKCWSGLNSGGSR